MGTQHAQAHSRALAHSAFALSWLRQRQCDRPTCGHRYRYSDGHCHGYTQWDASAPSQPGPLGLGTAAPLAGGGTITVFEHRKGIEPQDPNQEAIDIQVCVPAQTSGSRAVIYQRFWSLRDASNRTYIPASTTWQHPGANPAFWPPEQQVKGGDCYRAWVIIEGSNATPMTTARYSNDETGVILDWNLTQ